MQNNKIPRNDLLYDRRGLIWIACQKKSMPSSNFFPLIIQKITTEKLDLFLYYKSG